MPLNPTTGKLIAAAMPFTFWQPDFRGYGDPRWMTYKQASDQGWQVRKGERGTQIEFWEVKDPRTRQTIPAAHEWGGY